MRAELSNQPTGWACVRDALAEVRTGQSELQTFVSDMFDDLDGLADQLVGSKIAQDCAIGHAEHDALHEQIDRLASLAAELAQSVAEQKRLTTPEANKRGR
jgi:hypothetical protein